MKNKQRQEKQEICQQCSCCLSIGKGDYFCDQILELVLEKYIPTKHFGGCRNMRKELHNGGDT